MKRSKKQEKGSTMKFTEEHAEKVRNNIHIDLASAYSNLKYLIDGVLSRYGKVYLFGKGVKELGYFQEMPRDLDIIVVPDKNTEERKRALYEDILEDSLEMDFEAQLNKYGDLSVSLPLVFQYGVFKNINIPSKLNIDILVRETPSLLALGIIKYNLDYLLVSIGIQRGERHKSLIATYFNKNIETGKLYMPTYKPETKSDLDKRDWYEKNLEVEYVGVGVGAGVDAEQGNRTPKLQLGSVIETNETFYKIIGSNSGEYLALNPHGVVKTDYNGDMLTIDIYKNFKEGEMAFGHEDRLLEIVKKIEF